MATREEQKNFSELIETLVTEKKMTYIDAIVHHCERTGFEVELAATLISTRLKSRIRDEASAVNLIKKSSKLPL